MRTEICDRCGCEMRLVSKEGRLEVHDDTDSPFPRSLTLNVVYIFECPRCGAGSSVLDDSQEYVRRRTGR